MLKNRWLMISLVIVLLATSFSGCTKGTKSSAILWGSVNLDQPIEDATVSIYTADGEMIFEEVNSTHPSGFFMIEVDSLPSEFEIVATGGTLGNESFTGTVVRQVQGFDGNEYYYVNALTTLIDTYEDNHPEMSFNESKDTVESFLGIQSVSDIDDVIAAPDHYAHIFSHDVFMTEVENAGGFNDFIDTLGSEIDSGVDQHPFFATTRQGLQSGSGGILGGILKGIGTGVLSWAGGQLAGWAFDAIMGGGESDELGEINAQLNTLSSQVADLEQGQAIINNKLHALQEQILQSFNALSAQAQELSRLQAENEKVLSLEGRLNHLLGDIKDPISAIDTAFYNVCDLAEDAADALNNSDTDTLAECQTGVSKKTDEILNIGTGIEVYLGILHNNILSFLDDEGILEIWSTLAAKGSITEADFENAYQCFENHYAYLLGMEIKGINLCLEAYHGKYGGNSTQAASFWERWKGNLEEQIDTYSYCVERMVCSRIDTVTGKELNTWETGEAYNTSVVLSMAYKFTHDVLSGLNGENESTGDVGVLTATIVNFPQFTGENLSDNMDIHANDMHGHRYQPESTVRRDGTTIKDAWGESYSYQLIHFDYGEVPLETYALGRDIWRWFYAHISSANDSACIGLTEYLPDSYINWGKAGSAAGQFNNPWGVATDKAGNVYITDSKNYRVQKFDSNGNFLTDWGIEGPPMAGYFEYPLGIAVDKYGNVYVTDGNNAVVQKFDSNGNFITNWGTEGSGDGQFKMPWGIATDNAGNVYVADSHNNRVQKFDSSGSFITKWGSAGSGDGQFACPIGIAVDNFGNVYVADGVNYRVQKFDKDGNFITKWGTEGSGDGQFEVPKGIAVDALGNVYVVDNGNSRIQRFDSNGNYIAELGSRGSGDEQFVSPEGIAVDNVGNLYVVDSSNSRVSFFRGLIVEKHVLKTPWIVK